MNKQIKISKLDAAKRQLETAIRLYFNFGEPISIHTLACAAFEILSDLNKHNVGSPMGLSDYIIREEYKDRYKQMIRKPQNFFKHANRDPERAIDFNPDVTPFYIYDAIQKYQEMTRELVSYFRIFRSWYCAQNIDMFLLSSENINAYIKIKEKYGSDRFTYFSDMLRVSGKLT
jgi:hypothetical protein